MPLPAGTRLGPYEILSQIGAGGMGEVYKARDTRLGRLVAIKVLPPEKVADPERQRRFEQEAIAASALNHPNIVTVYDIGKENGLAYMAMELISGKSLDQLIPRQGMRTGEILRVAAQIADAFTTAHAGGIVHRDLKPANVMMTPEGLVKILDFGLAKLTQRAVAEADATRTMRAHTEVGAVLGTAAYMSPEQTEGKPVDARSDIFAFGSLLYEMATGRRAFRGDTPMSTMSSILRDEPAPLEQAREDLPPQLARVIVRCLRKDPTRRFQHMADLKVELEDLKEESSSGKLTSAAPAVAPAARPSRMPMWIAIAAVTVIAAVAGIRLLTERPSAVPAPQAAPTNSTVTSSTTASSTTPKSTTPAESSKSKEIAKSMVSAPIPPQTVAPSNPPAPQPDTYPANTKKIANAPPAAQAPETAATNAAKAAFDQGMRLIDQEKPSEALTHFDEAIRANPDFLNAYLGRAEARRMLGQYAMSIEDCNNAVRIGPREPRAYFCRGLAEGFLKQYEAAIRDDSEAIRLNPDFALAYDNRGNVYSNLQQYDHALEDFSQTIRIRPNMGLAYLRRAAIYEQLKQYSKAIQDYDEAIRLQPGNARAYRGRANAKKMSGDGRGAAADRRYAKQLKE